MTTTQIIAETPTAELTETQRSRLQAATRGLAEILADISGEEAEV